MSVIFTETLTSAVFTESLALTVKVITSKRSWSSRVEFTTDINPVVTFI